MHFSLVLGKFGAKLKFEQARSKLLLKTFRLIFDLPSRKIMNVRSMIYICCLFPSTLLHMNSNVMIMLFLYRKERMR